MKRFAFVFLLAGWLVPLASAQETEHVQVGVFADYFRLSQTHTNFAGVGARVGFIAYKSLKLEAEMSYDFNQAFTSGFTNNSDGSVSIHRSNLRVLHGAFGPRVNLGERWHVHPFLTLKGGFINFNVNNSAATVGNFFNSVDNLQSSNMKGVLYPGGGFEGHVGPVGVRLDIGDEIYWSGGTRNNLRVSLGPYIRF